MDKLYDNFAKNVSTLRSEKKMTQSELASKLNYSDKSVSKWERGESVPPIETLKAIADLFGVTIDYLISDNGNGNLDKTYTPKENSKNKIIITLLAVILVWFIAIVMYFYAVTLLKDYGFWKLFVGAVPVSFVVLLIFNCIWGKTKLTFIIISCLVWTTLAAIYIFFIENNPWLIFIIGIPLQIGVILWSNLKRK